MAQTPAERRAKRDASARQRINPDTGQHFRNYNQLDLWQRNQKAKEEGFSSRAVKRTKLVKGEIPSAPRPSKRDRTPEQTKASALPNSFRFFLKGREPTESLATEFNYALGPLPRAVDGDERFRRQAERERILRFHQGENWPMWRNEYDAVYG